MIEFLLPDSVPLWAGIALILFSYVTSAITVTFGLGGGVMMLVAIGSVLPPLAVIPVHGVVQFGSNAGRAYMMRAHAERRISGFFVIGALLGVAVAAQVVISVPQAALQAVLACFILYTVWGPKLGKHKISAAGFIVVGAATTFATMFVGATGPLLAAFLPPDRYGKMVTVATHSACMTVQHGVKVVAFGIVGFAFPEWIPLIAAMIATGFLGTATGKRFLERMPERIFAIGFKTVLTLLAARLLWVGVSNLMP
ncbi:sulfite exporter TauE/SafE family protein [Nisaea sp.]|uniref:sulfite exporter TauE/SafE family protein n=1 Tax=Nisaea sp. TaxID=2024842 RepID=UPI0032EAF67B